MDDAGRVWKNAANGVARRYLILGQLANAVPRLGEATFGHVDERRAWHLARTLLGRRLAVCQSLRHCRDPDVDAVDFPTIALRSADAAVLALLDAHGANAAALDDWAAHLKAHPFESYPIASSFAPSVNFCASPPCVQLSNVGVRC